VDLVHVILAFSTVVDSASKSSIGACSEVAGSRLFMGTAVLSEGLSFRVCQGRGVGAWGRAQLDPKPRSKVLNPGAIPLISV